jgi:hypothetical protein
MMRVSHRQLVAAQAEDNPIQAHDHNSIHGAIKTAHEKFLVKYIADGKNGLPIVYTPHFGKDQEQFLRDPDTLYWYDYGPEPWQKPQLRTRKSKSRGPFVHFWEARQLFEKSGWYHWPLTPKRVMELPANARSITAEDWREHGVGEACEHCGASEAQRWPLHRHVFAFPNQRSAHSFSNELTFELMRPIDAPFLKNGQWMVSVTSMHKPEEKRIDAIAVRHNGRRLGKLMAVAENPVDENGIPWVKDERDPKFQEEIVELQNRTGPIACSRDVYNLLSPWATKQKQEHLLVVLVDIHSELIGVALIHKGERDRVAVDPADIISAAAKQGAKGVCIVHNHPSGQAQHSPADADLTKTVREACEAANLAFMDHVVLGTGEFYSFADKKLYKQKGSRK